MQFTKQALDLLKTYYLKAGESPEDGFLRAINGYIPETKPELRQRLLEYVQKGWFMFSSPQLSNAPSKEHPARGLPISCFLQYVPDSVKGLIDHTAETRMLSVMGGGIGGHWSDIRAVSDIAPGPIPFLKTMDSDMIAYRQGVTRKGSYAAYMNVDHADFLEFLRMRTPTGGDEERKCFNLHHAVNLTDDFMKAVMDDKDHSFKCPHTGHIVGIMPAREVWQLILETRYRTGEPYLNFIDTANKALPQLLKDSDLKIHGSNLCNEIHLPTNEERTAVCCLCSLNLEYFDEWKGTEIVGDLIEYLDYVLTYFIDNASESLSKAVYSAFMSRDLGLGAMGFHSYLQRKGVPFESGVAQMLNEQIFSHIKKKAVERSKQLARELGGCSDMEGTIRNSHLLAIAPNANSSLILGTSPGVEPIKSNYYVHRTRAGSHIIINKYLEKLLEEKGINDKQTWKSIDEHGGSVQHLEALSDYEKSVFKTWEEIDQSVVVDLAAQRQKHICQGQSINLLFPKGASKAYINAVHLEAYIKGLKGLYYLRTFGETGSVNIFHGVERYNLGELNNPEAVTSDDGDCVFCQG